MKAETKSLLFDIAKSQDALMQNMSAELGVKTSLYVVFSIFLFNAAFQINSFVKDIHGAWSRRAIESSMIGAAIALAGALALLVAALVRNYNMFPLPESAKWLKDMDDYRKEFPNEKIPDEDEALREIMEETIAANKTENERKADWVTVGSWLLFLAVPFVALAGLFSFFAYRMNRP